MHIRTVTKNFIMYLLLDSKLIVGFYLHRGQQGVFPLPKKLLPPPLPPPPKFIEKFIKPNT